MGQLSNTFFFRVVPRLFWVCLNNDERDFLLLFIGYNDYAKASTLLDANAECLFGPMNWFVKSPRVTPVELADALSKWGKQADRDYFFNGYTLNLCLMQPSDKSEPWHFGHVVNVCRAGPKC